MSKLVLAGVLAWSGATLFAQSIVTCSSDDMRRHYCNADTRNGVRLARQRSDANCREGSTWGYDRRGIWVDRGCRADFEVNVGRGGFGAGRGGFGDGRRDGYGYGRGRGGYGGYDGGGSVISCSSDDMRRHYCSADTRGGVSLVKQHSDAACRQGSTWGYDRRGIWVDRGCRADFALRR